MRSSEFQLVSPDFSRKSAQALFEPSDVRTRLLELHPDLTPELFSKAILKGLMARHETTQASAPTAAGIKQWLDTLDELRSLLLEKQWTKLDQKNCPFAIAPDYGISIVVMTGNSDTGRLGFDDPVTSAEKGTVAKGYVTKNQQVIFKQAQELPGTKVWALLYHYDKTLKEVRYELSLPTEFNKNKITGWGERIILNTIPDNPTDFKIVEETPNIPVTVEVLPKTGSSN